MNSEDSRNASILSDIVLDFQYRMSGKVSAYERDLRTSSQSFQREFIESNFVSLRDFLDSLENSDVNKKVKILRSTEGMTRKEARNLLTSLPEYLEEFLVLMRRESVNENNIKDTGGRSQILENIFSASSSDRPEEQSSEPTNGLGFEDFLTQIESAGSERFEAESPFSALGVSYENFGFSSEEEGLLKISEYFLSRISSK